MKEGTTTLYQQSNKAHKGQSKKIEKRRNQQKLREKEKKNKKLKAKKSKLKPSERLDKYVGKLLRTAKGETGEIEEMFGMMDEGAEVRATHADQHQRCRERAPAQDPQKNFQAARTRQERRQRVLPPAWLRVAQEQIRQPGQARAQKR